MLKNFYNILSNVFWSLFKFSRVSKGIYIEKHVSVVSVSDVMAGGTGTALNP